MPLLQSVGRPRDERRRKTRALASSPAKNVGVNRVIRVVSTGDLTFAIDEAANATEQPAMEFPVREAQPHQQHQPSLICMTASGFTLALLLLLAALFGSCGLSAYLCARLRPFRKKARPEVMAVRTFAAVRMAGGPAGKQGNESTCFYS